MPARADQASQNTPHLDGQLIVQIGQRNKQALEMLYDRYGALVYTIAVRITQDRALAETIVQEVFYAVWQSASSIQIGARVPVWLSRMARKQALTAVYLQGSRMRTCVATHQETHTIGQDEQGAGGAEALNMRRAFDGLPTDQRETIELAYYDGLTCREIATRLREPVSTIKTRLRVGLCTLSEQLGNAAAHLGKRNLL
jgi:RNA polymerase sigma-70 factor (ECF subfamily)